MYIEYLSFLNFVFFLYNVIFKEKINLKNKTIYFFETNYLFNPLIFLFKLFFNINFKYLDFELRKIKDNNNELIRLRIGRKDLFDIQNQVLENYKDIFNELKNNKEKKILYFYLKRSITEGHIVMNPESLLRAIFIIQVTLWHSNKNNCLKPIFFLSNRNWFSELTEYSKKYNIKIIKIPHIKKFKKNFKYYYNIRKDSFPLLGLIYNFLKNIFKLKTPFYYQKKENSKIYSQNFGFFNLTNDGMNSNLFFYLNSDINPNDLVCLHKSKKELFLLKKNNFNIIDTKISFTNFNLSKKINLSRNLNLSNKKNISFFKRNIRLFNNQKKHAFFINKSNDIKIFLTWDKFLKDHISKYQAIKEAGGIFAIWQYAFEGRRSINLQMNSDLYFSNFSKKFYVDNDSYSKYFVTTGFINDYRHILLKNKALEVRKKIESKGAKYIISIFDENSNDYHRWHTGHSMQIENYEYILEEVLKNSEFGVIFKPKKPLTLKNRLGNVSKLLTKAEETGRCLVYYENSSLSSSIPPILAGLSSDLCIHSHLCAGTAALECSLAGIPTILIDREGDPENLLYSLSKNDIIFKNWDDAIYALKKHFNSKNKNNKFGIWPDSFLNELDPFRDGKAAFRMGEYLNVMLKEFKNNKSSDEVLKIAADIYSEKYGHDKVFKN